MSTKKRASKKSSAKGHPTKALLKDLKEVFEKHQWSGNAIGIALSPAAHNNIKAAAATADTGCPDGSLPQIVKFQLPDGTWVFKKICGSL